MILTTEPMRFTHSGVLLKVWDSNFPKCLEAGEESEIYVIGEEKLIKKLLTENSQIISFPEQSKERKGYVCRAIHKNKYLQSWKIVIKWAGPLLASQR